MRGHSFMSVIAGVHEQYQGPTQTNVEGTLERYPKTMVTREFNAGVIKPQNLVPKLKNLCQEVWDAGLVCAVSFKLSPAEVYNRKWLPFIQQAADYIKTQGKTGQTLFILWHEAENDFGKKSNYFHDANDFVGYFNIVHDAIKGTNPGLLTVYAALGYAFRDRGEISDDEAKALSRIKADIKAIDIYSGRSFPLDTILPELSGFRRWLEHTVGPDAPYGVTERGWMADTDDEHTLRAATVMREADWLRTDPTGRRCKLWIGWLTEGTENDPTLKPDSKMAAAVNYLLTRVNEPDPEPEVVEPKQPAQTDCPLCLGTGKVPAGSTYTIVRSEGV